MAYFSHGCRIENLLYRCIISFHIIYSIFHYIIERQSLVDTECVQNNLPYANGNSL
jgi:hypothetical protein